MIQGLRWSDVFAVGHPGLDREHRAIVETINAICETAARAPAAHQLEPLFSDLRTTTQQHFLHENTILRQVLASAERDTYSDGFLKLMGRGAFLQHIDNHQRDFTELDTIIAAVEHGRPLCHDLEHWFFSHAVKFDAHLKALFQAMQTECPRFLADLA